MRWNFWYFFAIAWAALGLIDIAASWITGDPRSDTDEFAYMMLSLILGYITEERKERR